MVFKMRTLSLPRTKEDLFPGSALKRFSWRELKLATDNFSKKNILGRGGFGSVYRGRLADGSLVAIKRCTSVESRAAEHEFQAELEIGGSQACDHPNVLRLVGYCMTRKERILVYPFMVNRSVYSWLHDRLPSDPPLDWPTRKRIALGAAKGLAHFHCGSSFTVIHRDVKSPNILLDDQLNAVICDFGLVKFIGRKENESHSNWVQRPMEAQYDDEDTFEEDEEEDSDHDNNGFTKSCWYFTRALVLRPEDAEESRGHTKWSCWAFTKNEVISESAPNNISAALPTYHEFCTHVSTGVCGTVGYLDPDYFSTNKCTVKIDVFGYGVTLLELVSGQRAIDRGRLSDGDASGERDASIYIWAKRLFGEGKLDMLVDSNLRGDYIEEMKELIQLALLCTKLDPRERPIMSEVTVIIENLGKHRCADQLLGAENHLLHRFTLPQLKLATDNFSNKNIIGRSAFNNLYRGCLQEDGSDVAVKRLVKRSKRGRMHFRAQVKLGGIRHHNLLQLRGYCHFGKEMLLVYPFMPNRSLEWQLRPERSLSLDWDVRMRIAYGVAKGIAYLHHDCQSNVTIGCNVKPYNILLDEDFSPNLCNLSLQSNDSCQDQDSSLDHTDTDYSFLSENRLDGAISSSADDVYGYGITLFVLISGKVSTCLTDRESFYNDSVLHDWFKKLRRHQLELLLDSRLDMGDNNYVIKDEMEQIIQVALLCTQPSPADRPEMWQVIQMLQGISEGDLKVCFAFDRANLFRFDESLQHQPVHEVEIGDTMDSPKLDSEGSVSTESDQTTRLQLCLTPKQDNNNSSKDKEVASFSVYHSKAQHTKLRSRYKGITISDDVLETKMQEIWLSEVVLDALPTKSKVCQSRTSVDPLCPMCNEYDEDSFHLFFKCDFSRQAWQLAVGVRIDMFGFGSVKEAVDVILKPNGAGLNILPRDVEPSRFTRKGVALMHSIWTHRNQVCFDNVCPNVIQMLKDYPDATDLYESPSAAQKEVEAGSRSESTFDADGCAIVASDLACSVECGLSLEVESAQLQPQEVLPKVLANSVLCETSQEIEPALLQPEQALIPQFLPICIQWESSHDIQPRPEELFPEVLVNCIQCESSQEIKQAQLLLEEVPFPQVLSNYVQCESSQETKHAQLQPEVLFPEILTRCVQSGSSQESEQAQLHQEKVLIPQVIANCIKGEPSEEIKLAQLQSEKVLPKVHECGINNNNKHHDFQLNISSGGVFLSFKFTKLSVISVILLASLCMNLVFIRPWAKLSY